MDTEPSCEWVDATIAKLMTEHHEREEPVLRGRGLAKAWAGIEDPALKSAAFSDIRARWREKGWWETTPRGKSAQEARAIYDEYSAAENRGH